MAIKLTESLLKRLIMEEKQKLHETLEMKQSHPSKVKAREVKVDGFADTLEAKIDHYKAMKLHESELMQQYIKLREARMQLKKRLLSELN
jgi:hypothetical protein